MKFVIESYSIFSATLERDIASVSLEETHELFSRFRSAFSILGEYVRAERVTFERILLESSQKANMHPLAQDFILFLSEWARRLSIWERDLPFVRELIQAHILVRFVDEDDVVLKIVEQILGNPEQLEEFFGSRKLGINLVRDIGFVRIGEKSLEALSIEYSGFFERDPAIEGLLLSVEAKD